MNRTIALTLLMLACTACFASSEPQRQEIRISTDRVDLILEVAPDQRLYQLYLGERLSDTFDIRLLSRPEYI